MRRFTLAAIVLIVAVLGIGLFVRTWRGQTQPSVSVPGTAVVTIPVEGMVCVSCTASVKKALKSIGGVTEAEVSLERREVRVRYMEEKVSPKALTAVITKLGYIAGTPSVERERR